MAVFLLTSQRGAPGVTTSALALAVTWPRPVLLIEADASGSSAILAGFLRGQHPGLAGIVDAAVALRHDVLSDELPTLLIGLPGTEARLLPGMTNPAQSRTMVRAWPELAPALVEYGHRAGLDLIVDAGRLGMIGHPGPLLKAADQVLLTTRTDLPSVHGASVRLPELIDLLPDPSRLGLLVIGDGDPYGAREISKYLEIPVRGQIGWDPVGARTFSHGARAPRKPGPLARSAPQTAIQLLADLPAADREFAHA